MRMTRMTAAFLPILLAGCNPGCNWDETDDEILAQYASTPLEGVYSEHLLLVSNCTPSRTTLALKLAEFGPVAKEHALSRLRRGDTRSFAAALSTVSAVNAAHDLTCTRAEFNRLSRAVEELSVSREVKDINIKSIRNSCGLHK